jgi:hypothetical protein
MTNPCLAPGLRMTWVDCPCLWRSFKSVEKDTLWTNWKVETFVCSKTLLTFCGNIMLRNAWLYVVYQELFLRLRPYQPEYAPFWKFQEVSEQQVLDCL